MEVGGSFVTDDMLVSSVDIGSSSGSLVMAS